MSEEFVRPLDGIRLVKVNDVERERCVRLYKSGPEDWTFQIRAPIGLGTFGLRDGKDFIVASATLSFDDLRALHLAFRDMFADALADAALRDLAGLQQTQDEIDRIAATSGRNR